jgi:hypothetical protein
MPHGENFHLTGFINQKCSGVSPECSAKGNQTPGEQLGTQAKSTKKSVSINIDDDDCAEEVVGEFRKTRHPRVKFDKVLETCFSGAGNSRFSEAWNL